MEVDITPVCCYYEASITTRVTMKTEKSFTFRIPVDLLDAAHVLAVKQDLTLAQLVRRLLREVVEKEGTAHG